MWPLTVRWYVGKDNDIIHNMNNNSKIVVAVELGSSKLSGAAARKNEDGSLEVIACASVPSSSFIHQGSVYNLDKTAEGLALLNELLERQSGTRILQVFTGFAGKSLRSSQAVVSRDLPDGNIVTSELVDEMLIECGEMPSEGMLSLSIASQEFTTDHKSLPESDPIGIACTHIDGRFQRIMIRPKLFRLLDDSFRHAAIQLVDSYIQPVTLADMLLTADERQKGCALVDYGADTTTVSVFKGGQLCYLRVLPLGSDTITKDIMSVFRLNHDEAESLKLTYGLFNLSGSVEEKTTMGGNEVSLKLLGEVIESRNEEIMANVIHQIRNSGYYDSLFSGVVVTGGGSNLKKLHTAMTQLFTGLSPIRFAKNVPSDIKWCETDWDLTDATHLGLLSLLLHADENCCEEKEEIDMYAEPSLEEQKAMTTGDLFTPEGEDAQLERDRKAEEKRREEETRRQRERDEKAAAEAISKIADEARRTVLGEDSDDAEVKEKKPTKGQRWLDMARTSLHKFFEDVQ